MGAHFEVLFSHVVARPTTLCGEGNGVLLGCPETVVVIRHFLEAVALVVGEVVPPHATLGYDSIDLELS